MRSLQSWASGEILAWLVRSFFGRDGGEVWVPSQPLFWATCTFQFHCGTGYRVQHKTSSGSRPIPREIVRLLCRFSPTGPASLLRTSVRDYPLSASILRTGLPCAGNLRFEGPWGFQYYMGQNGSRPIDIRHPGVRPGDSTAIPSNNIQLVDIPATTIASWEEFELDPGGWASTVDSQLGAGFYSSYWGPLPFVIGRARSELYSILQLVGPNGP